MKALNERLQKAQEAQAARQEDLQKGKIRIERREEHPPKKDKQKANA